MLCAGISSWRENPSDIDLETGITQSYFYSACLSLPVVHDMDIVFPLFLCLGLNLNM
jgi:hypothetical protein